MAKNLFINQGVIIHMNLSAEIPKVQVNKIQIQQVLINLIKNFWQA
jgi:C4-dicarboxylate-specific signal transduction histidine kinase